MPLACLSLYVAIVLSQYVLSVSIEAYLSAELCSVTHTSFLLKIVSFTMSQ